MALRALSAQELAATPTLFESFMGCEGRRHRTVGELLAIYRDRCTHIEADQDADYSLRVEDFVQDMLGERWREDLVLRIGVFDGEVRVIDGTHRGIAYLACLEDGVEVDRLPALHVDC